MIPELERGNDKKTREEKEMRDLERGNSRKGGGSAFDKRAGHVLTHSLG